MIGQEGKTIRTKVIERILDPISVIFVLKIFFGDFCFEEMTSHLSNDDLSHQSCEAGFLKAKQKKVKL
jgi:hypothetical protein